MRFVKFCANCASTALKPIRKEFFGGVGYLDAFAEHLYVSSMEKSISVRNRTAEIPDHPLHELRLCNC